jgi:muconate cycloisomerase
MERHDLLYVEQPVAGLVRLAEVWRFIAVPVMADESCWGPPDVIDIVRLGTADIVSIYTTKLGGLYKGLAVAATALVCNLNGSVETGVGNLANVHLAAAAHAVTLSCVVPVSAPKQDLGDRMARSCCPTVPASESTSIRRRSRAIASGIERKRSRHSLGNRRKSERRHP